MTSTRTRRRQTTMTLLAAGTFLYSCGSQDSPAAPAAATGADGAAPGTIQSPSSVPVTADTSSALDRYLRLTLTEEDTDRVRSGERSPRSSRDRPGGEPGTVRQARPADATRPRRPHPHRRVARPSRLDRR